MIPEYKKGRNNGIVWIINSILLWIELLAKLLQIIKSPSKKFVGTNYILYVQSSKAYFQRFSLSESSISLLISRLIDCIFSSSSILITSVSFISIH